MKKLVLILLALTLITSCENEPIDPGLTGQIDTGGNDNGGNDDDDDDDDDTDSGDLSLSVYELDTDISINFFGFPLNTVTNSDLNINNNIIVSGNIVTEVEGAPAQTENQTFTRNNEGQITSIVSVNTGGVTTNEYIISYSDGRISQITYDFFEDDFDDYVYNFTYAGNVITRTEQDSDIVTEFTLDANDRIISKTSTEAGFSLQSETITYNANGNISTSTGTGDLDSDYSYDFDDNPNPLQVVYGDNYLVNFLTDDYTDELGPTIAQFHSTNNWIGATFNGDAFTFSVEYNAAGRIDSRAIDYDFGDDLMVSIDEEFNYVN